MFIHCICCGVYIMGLINIPDTLTGERVNITRSVGWDFMSTRSTIITLLLDVHTEERFVLY